MADYIELDIKNPAVGSTELGNAVQNETQRKLDSLMMNIEKPENPEDKLGELNSVVGLPSEREILLDDLVDPPSDWVDIFKSAKENDVEKMAASIYQYGLLHRVTLWQNEQEKYIVLGGLTRVAAYRYLYQLTSDQKWSSIPAKIYTREQIDEIDAKRIFIVSNTDQRQMSTKGIVKAYYNLMKLEKERSFYGSGIFARDSAAKQANVPKSTFGNYLKLMNLLPELVDEIDSGNLQMMVGYELAFIPEDLQKYIFDKKLYLNLKRNTAKKIRHDAKTFEDIDKIISDSELPSETFKYSVEVGKQLPDDCEILPLVVNKNDKVEVLNLLQQAVNNSNFADDVKNKLLEVLK